MNRRLCAISDIPENGSRGFTLDGLSLFALRDRGRCHVYLNRCPHLGVELDWEPHQFLDNEGTFIRCATHGALFEKHNGECIQGPCRGLALQKIPHRETDGNIYL